MKLSVDLPFINPSLQAGCKIISTSTRALALIDYQQTMKMFKLILNKLLSASLFNMRLYLFGDILCNL